jgi:hypothetical protein
MIGIDPHKGSHTAYAVDASEKRLGQVRVRASIRQVDGLLEWAARWPERVWAIEGARGLGHLLASALLTASERVVDVQPKLAARVRLLNTGQVNKNDPNDARSVAIAALRSPDVRPVAGEDHAAVLKVWARRHRDLSRARNRTACRLHAVLCELVPGGFAREITAGQAMQAIEEITAHGPAAAARLELAHELLAELRHIDEQRRDRLGTGGVHSRGAGSGVPSRRDKAHDQDCQGCGRNRPARAHVSAGRTTLTSCAALPHREVPLTQARQFRTMPT